MSSRPIDTGPQYRPFISFLHTMFGIRKFAMFAALLMATPLSAQVWTPGQQLTVDPKTVTVTEGDTVVFRGYARTSSGVAVANPGVKWTLSSTSGASVVSLTSDRAVVRIKPSAQPQTVKLRAAWATRSGTFRDSAVISIVSQQSYLPWGKNQQVLIMPREANIVQTDTVALKAFARTSTGVPVTAPGITWRVTDTSLAKVTSTGPNTATLRPTQRVTNGAFYVVATWTTRSGSLRDSVVYTFRHTNFDQYAENPRILPWENNAQRVVAFPKGAWFEPNGGKRDTVGFRAFARAAEGQQYANVTATFTLNDSTNFGIRQIRPDSAEVFLRGSASPVAAQATLYTTTVLDGIAYKDSSHVFLWPLRLSSMTDTACEPPSRRSIVTPLTGQPVDVITTQEEPTKVRYHTARTIDGKVRCLGLAMQSNTRNPDYSPRYFAYASYGTLNSCSFGVRYARTNDGAYATWQEAITALWAVQIDPATGCGKP